MFQICLTSRERNAKRRRRSRADDGQLAFLCGDRRRWRRVIAESNRALLKCPSKICFFFAQQNLNYVELQLHKSSIGGHWNHTRLRNFSANQDCASKKKLLSSTKVQIPKIPSLLVTCWIVFHIRIIYIGEGCIYSPLLIKHPQPLRSYLENCFAIYRV